MSRPFGLQDLMMVISRQWRKMAAVFLATVVTAGIGTLLQTPIYEATSTLMVKFGRQNIYRTEVGDHRFFVNDDWETIIAAELQILNSRDLLQDVLLSLGVEKVYPDIAENAPDETTALSAAVGLLENSLSIQGVADSNVIGVSFRHPAPETTATVVNQIVDLFQEKHVLLFGDPQATTFLEEKVSTYKKMLDESEEQLKNYQLENEAFELEEQRTQLLRQQTAHRQSLDLTTNRIAELERETLSLEQQLETLSEDTSLITEENRYRAFDDAKTQLLRLQLRERELLATYKETNRQVVNIRAQIKLVNEFLEEQKRAIQERIKIGKNEVHVDVQKAIIRNLAELEALQARKAGLQRQLAQFDERITRLPVQEKQLRRLSMQRDANQKNYQTYLQRLEEARISADMDLQKMASIRVIEKGSVPMDPISPNKKLNMIIGVAIGLFIGIAVAAASEWVPQQLSWLKSYTSSKPLPPHATEGALEKQFGEEPTTSVEQLDRSTSDRT
jgi:uncharacterized protein involved in exopolysaccharide biosynthesis